MMPIQANRNHVKAANETIAGLLSASFERVGVLKCMCKIVTCILHMSR